MVNGSIYVEALSAVQKQQVLEARQLPYQEVSERICSRLSPRRYNLLISYDLYGELLQDSRISKSKGLLANLRFGSIPNIDMPALQPDNSMPMERFTLPRIVLGT